MIEVQCACGKGFRVKSEHGGKRIKCPACNGAVSVPIPAIGELIDIRDPIARWPAARFPVHDGSRSIADDHVTSGLWPDGDPRELSGPREMSPFGR
jgi:hypothetical protein